MMEKFDVAVIGGGAAGLFAANMLKCKSVAIFEASERVGRKIMISGNGRCNLSNINLDFNKYNDKAFVLSSITKYGCDQIRDIFYSFGLLTRVENGRVYPYSESSNSVLDVLLSRLQKMGRNIFTMSCVEGISGTDGNFIIKTLNSEYLAKKIIFTAGSPASGGRDSLNLLCEFGHTVRQFFPALVPLKCKTDKIKGLNGVRAKCRASLIKNGKEIASEIGEVLFKDYGLSGIAVFNLSSYIARNRSDGYSISIDFMPEYSLNELLRMLNDRLVVNASKENFFRGLFNKILAQNILRAAKVGAKIEQKDLIIIAQTVKNYVVDVISLLDLKNSQVASGGLNTDEFDLNTLESKIQKGIYAAGEALNIDGLCGGYNLHWAWASGAVAAICVDKALNTE